MKVYLCAPYARRPEMQGVSEIMEAQGHIVTSRWVYSKGPIGTFADTAAEYASNTDTCGRGALRDFEDIREADTLIAFTDGELARGGRHVEFGYAAALGKHLIVVGPRETLFHCLPFVEWLEDWPRFVTYLVEQAELIRS